MKGKISIVIPVYNEENFINETISKVIDADSRGYEKEIIIVDDGSRDKTVENIKLFIENRHENKNFVIKLIAKEKNEGKGAALKNGFLETTGDIVIIQDADLEYSPDDYPLLLESFVTHNADVVYGSRFISNRPHRVLYFWHYLANNMLTLFSNVLTNLNLTDMETGYKVFRGDLIREIAPKLKSKRFGFEPEITARITKIKDLKMFEVGISYWGRTYQEGKKIGWKDGVKAILEIMRFNLFSR
ncbi:glycosyl transferase [Candidatus Roizmanbacteria bacterium RIFCSPHIGHO2_01_FULL_39_12b]|uniref:Glycosyl transferase n=1 Tax=Candidatus Roizmanbacteria bacterium RIFCSPHIGHO2_01_FULL_39_12b TaxID=1802030 RepID=A0A1F7GC19_9BACT|nr:MAG: glycosyl transferase [Candidatus Roizmanbacteria bacterium RIFCSPHIGHO2_01_FULL_39_12b]OGK46145.1 MAG: glycosyl transferase [Candidatus Roizmanbacteria bacterium RIFCSPLOWO2_01_FULL_39_19]